MKIENRRYETKHKRMTIEG